MNSEQPKTLDAEVLDTLHDAIGDSMAQIIKLFLDDFPHEIAEMQQALQANDFATVGRLAHSLKSSSANLGAMQLSALAAELEHSIGDGNNDKAKIATAITGLSTSFDQARDLYSKYI